MRLLLDTHIYLWCVQDNRRLSKTARDLILKAVEVYVSSISIWETSIKVKLGKLKVDVDDLAEAITRSGFLELPFTLTHAAAVAHLPSLHRDPFDRALIAQAINEPLRFLTVDTSLKAYSEWVELV